MSEEIKKIKVLVVEDNPSDADILVDIFEHSNDMAIYGPYTIDAQWVKSLEEAKERLEQFDFDFIFQDLDLGETKGIETLRAIKKVSKNIPTIVTTTYINRKLWNEAFAEGAQDFILKNSINSQLVVKTIFYTLERLKHQNVTVGVS